MIVASTATESEWAMMTVMELYDEEVQGANVAGFLGDRIDQDADLLL